MNRKISVIIPVYKGEETLEKCVSSVIKQTYSNLEIILVDDGSPDNCPVICDQLASLDKRIISLHKKNGGQADARNYGLDHATGDYIGFLDDDDYIDEKMFETLIKNAEKHNVDISCCANYMVFPDGKTENRFSDMKTGFYDSSVLIRNILFQSKHASGAVWNKLFSRKYIDDLHFPTGSQYEDYWVMVRLLFKVDRVYFDNTPLYFWIQSPNSQSKRPYHEGLRSGFDIARKMKLFFCDNKAPKRVLYQCDYFEFLIRHNIICAMSRSDSKDIKKMMASELRMQYLQSLKLFIHMVNTLNMIKMVGIDTIIYFKTKVKTKKVEK